MTADMRSPAPAATGNGASIDKNKAEGLRSTKQSKRRQAAKAFFEGAAQLSPRSKSGGSCAMEVLGHRRGLG
jgi:hypothetical protein